MFDKTGTLTEGKPVVVSTRLLRQMVLQDFYELVAAAEVVHHFLLPRITFPVLLLYSFHPYVHGPDMVAFCRIMYE